MQQKVNTWSTLERKVLRKLNVFLHDTTILKLAEANTDTVKVVLYEAMQKSKLALAIKANSSSSISDNLLSCKKSLFFILLKT